MASIYDLKSSKFLTQHDVGSGKLFCIERLEVVNVSKEGEEEEYKWSCFFRGEKKPLVLNSTNGKAIAKITGFKDDIEHNWVGWWVVLYQDEDIEFGGKKVGGIRIRAPKEGSVQQPGVVTPDKDTDLPF